MSNTGASTTHRFSFHGKGGELFGQFLVNWLLTVITLGIYYPWAQASLKRYFYRNTEFAGHSFAFHGTGGEMFIGFIKSVLVLAGAGVTAYLLAMATSPVAGIVFFYLLLAGLIPFAIVGSLQYTCSRSSWRNIHFSYHGTVGGMASTYFSGLFLTIITFGIYYPWFLASLEREITGHARFGRNVEFEYHGTGGDLFKKIIVGYLLTLVTLGVYSFWMIADLINYSYEQKHIHQNGRSAQFRSTLTGGGLLKLFLVDILLLVVTLGIATPWVVARNLSHAADNLFIEGNLDLDAIEAGDVAYATATGEALDSIINN
jgi:uncharacterized membrane protein YjgN (DUF898 family)